MEYEKWPNHNRHNTFNPFFFGILYWEILMMRFHGIFVGGLSTLIGICVSIGIILNLCRQFVVNTRFSQTWREHSRREPYDGKIAAITEAYSHPHIHSHQKKLEHHFFDWLPFPRKVYLLVAPYQLTLSPKKLAETTAGKWLEKNAPAWQWKLIQRSKKTNHGNSNDNAM